MSLYTYNRNKSNTRYEDLKSNYAINPELVFFDDVEPNTKISDRPQWLLIEKSIKSGDIIIVQTLDCLGGNLIEVLETIGRVANKKVKLYVLQFDGLDITSATGKYMMTMFCAVQEFIQLTTV